MSIQQQPHCPTRKVNLSHMLCIQIQVPIVHKMSRLIYGSMYMDEFNRTALWTMLRVACFSHILRHNMQKVIWLIFCHPNRTTTSTVHYCKAVASLYVQVFWAKTYLL